MKELIKDLASDPQCDTPEMLVGDVGVSVCFAMHHERDRKITPAFRALQKRDREGFKALDEFCSHYY